MVNADRNDNPDLMVWSQTVSVVPNSVYNFSAWISTWVVAGDLNISRLSFSINGESIGKQNAPGVTKVWEQFSASWNARGNTVANIQIYETGYEVGFLGGGNDFALDDISFVATSIAIPEPDSRTMYSIGFSFAGLFLHRRKKQSIKYFRG